MIDAGGLIVAPGFVDLHTHYDAQLFWDPYCTLSGWHGITSVVIGNCGFGFAPVRPAERERAMLSMTRVEAIPMASMQAGHAVELGDLPRVPRQRRRARPRRSTSCRTCRSSPMLVWVMGFEAAKAGKLPTRRAARRDARGCCTRRWMPAPAAGRPSACCRPGRRRCSATMTARRCRPTSCTTRPAASSPRCWPSATTASCRCCWCRATTPRDRGLLRGDGDASAAGRCIMNVVQAFDDRPHIHRRALEWLESCRERGIRVVGQGAHDRRRLHLHLRGLEPVRRLRGWCEATTGTREERLAKLADPARRRGAARQAADHRHRPAAADRHRRAQARRRTRSGSTTRWPMPARRWASIRST